MAAIEALLAGERGDRAAAVRFEAFAVQSRIRLDGFWAIPAEVAGPGGGSRTPRFAFSALAAPSAGRTATIYATQAKRPAEVDAVSAVIRAACRGARSLDVDLAQALVEPSDLLQIDAFERAGMERIATLSYLERPIGPRAMERLAGSALQPVPLPSDMQLAPSGPLRRDDPACAAERRALIEALERTYVDTLDCPALAGLRRGEDVLGGHIHSGRFEPELWTILRFAQGPLAGQIAGMCLVNGSALPRGGAGASVELVYLGLVPEARGRGLGALLLDRALRLVRGRSERSMVLAVDERNAPAMRLYERAGFRPSLRRVAFIQSVRA
ncbi:MAG: GNAT family N-acetyltransferase [Phycisphaerae bacterium]|nr:GNAT family N-acetyltransferase [Phycisphaerae bacterium]